jgi:hypothetical protein
MGNWWFAVSQGGFGDVCNSAVQHVDPREVDYLNNTDNDNNNDNDDDNDYIYYTNDNDDDDDDNIITNNINRYSCNKIIIVL